MKKIWLVGTLFVIILLLFFPFAEAFTFTETRTETPQLFYVTKENTNQFQFIYTHSIHLSDVIENYVVKDGDIQLHSMEYSDVAIGMPGYAEEGERLEYKDGEYTLFYDNKTLEGFTIYIGDVDHSLRFLYGESSYDLKKSLKRGKSYLFEVRKLSLFDILKGAKLNGR